VTAAHARQARRSRRRRSLGGKRLWIALGAAVFLGLGLLASFQVLSARRHLVAGSSALRDASSMLSPATRLRDPAIRARLRVALAHAQDEFASARSNLWLWSPVLDRLDWVPRYGSQLAAASPAADTSFYITRCAGHLMDGLQPVWPVVTHPRPSTLLLSKVAPLLDAGHGQFVAGEDDADRAVLALQRLPRHSGNSTLDTASARLRTLLPGIRAGSHWLAVAPLLLGSHAPSRYLILFQNPAQIRATGGFLGAVDFVTVGHGSIRSISSGSEMPHEIDMVSPPLLEAAYSAEGPWIFRDSNWSPDFPLSARLARWFYGEDTGRWTNGVVGIVDNAVVTILGATGPVYVPAYRQTVGANNVEALAQRYINQAYHGPIRGGGDTSRKQFFGHVFTALLQRIQSLPLQRWPALGTALAAASARRDIMVYDRRPQVQSAITESGADGSLRAVAGDFLSVVDTNWSYNKLNPYVREWAEYQVDVRRDLWLDATLTLHYHVAPSPDTLEGEGPGYGLQGSKHDYEDLLRVYVPRGAQLTAISGIDPWAPAPAYGLTQFAGRLLVREGQTRTVTIRYRVPANALEALGGSRYALTVRRQPGGDLTALHVVVQGGSGVTVAGVSSPPSVTRTLPLHQDGRLETPLGGQIQPRVVPLPAPSGPVDPYIPFTDFRDPRHPL
jgi:Protein of unknown function (DUF4012)